MLSPSPDQIRSTQASGTTRCSYPSAVACSHVQTTTGEATRRSTYLTPDTLLRPLRLLARARPSASMRRKPHILGQEHWEHSVTGDEQLPLVVVPTK
jgi:hypothetical protein